MSIHHTLGVFAELNRTLSQMQVEMMRLSQQLNQQAQENADQAAKQLRNVGIISGAITAATFMLPAVINDAATVNLIRTSAPKINEVVSNIFSSQQFACDTLNKQYQRQADHHFSMSRALEESNRGLQEVLPFLLRTEHEAKVGS